MQAIGCLDKQIFERSGIFHNNLDRQTRHDLPLRSAIRNFRHPRIENGAGPLAILSQSKVYCTCDTTIIDVIFNYKLSVGCGGSLMLRKMRRPMSKQKGGLRTQIVIRRADDSVTTR
ncbi:uncharacterized protein G2W53_038783 [Senna tora]|uniref:Uncharacterized protein n=1 Tax=Senna tora TaxID=362788 RepID=A0A834SMP9_9FABA|nr:uncharacterized protein G2W53_038783 [Senna tora]